MIEKNAYERNDIVKFLYEEKIKKGTVTSVDRHLFEGLSEHITYDIYSEDDNILYKHINELYILEKC